ncbi:hypothetical protein DEA98_23895 [Brucella pseudogrignonensis]|nr:hypothetical protein [Brucella pseudogrignonensis]
MRWPEDRAGEKFGFIGCADRIYGKHRRLSRAMRQPLSSHMPRAHCNGNKLVLPERLSIDTDCGACNLPANPQCGGDG